MVRDTPESVARRLGFAIERSGMTTLDSGSQGSYRFEYVQLRVDDRSLWQKVKFWEKSKTPNYTGIYRTRVEADGQDARVFLLFDSGESATTNSAEHVLGKFMERLG